MALDSCFWASGKCKSALEIVFGHLNLLSDVRIGIRISDSWNWARKHAPKWFQAPGSGSGRPKVLKFEFEHVCMFQFSIQNRNHDSTVSGTQKLFWEHGFQKIELESYFGNIDFRRLNIIFHCTKQVKVGGQIWAPEICYRHSKIL